MSNVDVHCAGLSSFFARLLHAFEFPHEVMAAIGKPGPPTGVCRVLPCKSPNKWEKRCMKRMGATAWCAQIMYLLATTLGAAELDECRDMVGWELVSHD